MKTKKSFLGCDKQIMTHILTIDAGDEVQIGGIADKELHVNVPWVIRLSIDAIYDAVIHYGSRTGWRQNKAAQIGLNPKDIPFNFQRLMTKSKNKVEWGTEDVTNEPVDNVFDFGDGNLILPHNCDLVDRKYKILNSGLLDSDQFCKHIMMQSLNPRPTVLKYKNDCHAVCVTFMPKGKNGFEMSNYKDQEWFEGAWFTWADDGPHTITQKGISTDYLVSTVNTVLTDGRVLAAGVPLKLTSESIEIAPSNNIILHIYR